MDCAIDYKQMQLTIFICIISLTSLYINIIPIDQEEMKNQKGLQTIQSVNKINEEFQLKITLKEKQQESIVYLWLYNKLNFDVYQLTMDQSFLKKIQMKQLLFWFSTPRLIFYEMKEMIDEIKINNQGFIKFDIGLGRNGMKEIKIELMKKQIDKIKFLLQRTNEIAAQSKNEIARIRNQYNNYMFDMRKQYTNQIQQLQKQIIQMNEEIKSLKQLVLNQNDALVKQEEELTAVIMNDRKSRSKMIQKKANERYKRKLKQKIKGITFGNSTQPFILSSQAQSQNLYKIRIQQLSSLVENPHNKSFKTEIKDKDSILIRKINHGGFFNYIPKLLIPMNNITRVQMKLQRTNQQYIMFGIGSRSTFGILDTYYRNNCMVYFCNNGWIYKNGGHASQGPIVADGESIEMIVDMVEYSIQWIVKGESLKSQIPTQLINKQTFIIIMMAHMNDMVRLSILK